MGRLSHGVIAHSVVGIVPPSSRLCSSPLPRAAQATTVAAQGATANDDAPQSNGGSGVGGVSGVGFAPFGRRPSSLLMLCLPSSQRLNIGICPLI